MILKETSIRGIWPGGGWWHEAINGVLTQWSPWVAIFLVHDYVIKINMLGSWYSPPLIPWPMKEVLL